MGDGRSGREPRNRRLTAALGCTPAQPEDDAIIPYYVKSIPAALWMSAALAALRQVNEQVPVDVFFAAEVRANSRRQGSSITRSSNGR
jgi:hypothetical protein